MAEGTTSIKFDHNIAKKTLTTNITLICEMLMWSDVKGDLFQSEILTMKDMSRINDIPGDFDKLFEVVQILITYNWELETKFQTFLDVLTTIDKKALVRKLIESYQQVGDEFSQKVPS